MRKYHYPFARIKTEIGPMTLYFNGVGEEVTAEKDDVIENIGYKPESYSDACDSCAKMYSDSVWNYDATCELPDFENYEVVRYGVDEYGFKIAIVTDDEAHERIVVVDGSGVECEFDTVHAADEFCSLMIDEWRKLK